MTRVTIAIVVVPLLFLSESTYGDPLEDVKNWYLTEYAPLWKSPTSTKPDQIRLFYVNGYREHFTIESSELVDNSEETWERVVEEIVDDGWLGLEVTQIEIQILNDRTASIRTQLTHKIAGGSNFVDCHWYLAAKQSDGWKFTNYVNVDCPAE